MKTYVKLSEKFVGLQATSVDVKAIDTIVDELRRNDRYTNQSDALR